MLPEVGDQSAMCISTIQSHLALSLVLYHWIQWYIFLDSTITPEAQISYKSPPRKSIYFFLRGSKNKHNQTSG